MEPAGFLLMYSSFAIHIGTRWVPFKIFSFCYKHWNPLGSFSMYPSFLYTLEPAGFLSIYPSFLYTLEPTGFNNIITENHKNKRRPQRGQTFIENQISTTRGPLRGQMFIEFLVCYQKTPARFIKNRKTKEDPSGVKCL